MQPGKTFQNLSPEKQERITRIAAEEFGDKGFDGASVNAMVDRMGWLSDNKTIKSDNYILILAAVDEEIAGLRANLKDPSPMLVGNRNAIFGKLGHHQVMLLAAGPGIINTAQALTAAIEARRPEMILQTGCAGAFHGSGLQIGDVAVASLEIDIQSGLEPSDGSPFPEDLPFNLLKNGGAEYRNHYPMNENLVAEVFEILRSNGETNHFHVRKGPFVTVSTITTTDERAKALFERFGPCMEQMEGAAAAHIALLYDIPFIEIRSASNMVGKRDKNTWNLPLAFQNACIAVEAVVEKLKIYANRQSTIANQQSTINNPTLSLAYSPCPNDTYIFYALAHRKIDLDDLNFDITLNDVEHLNQAARKNMVDISKLSFAAIGHLTETYGLLRTGAALGRGCGPLIVARKGMDLSTIGRSKIAIPGLWTTANLLLGLFTEQPPVATAMRFDDIMPAVSEGRYDFGVIIHEGRFTYQNYGLECLVDLGQWWEAKTGLPIPLGGIAARRNLPETVIRRVETAIGQSIDYARRHPQEADAYINAHAQELTESVIHQHIDLYVNDFSIDIGDQGEAAIAALFDIARKKGLLPESRQPLFAGGKKG